MLRIEKILNYKNSFFLLQFILCLSLYFVAVNFVQPLKIPAILLSIVGTILIYLSYKEKIVIHHIAIFWCISILPFLVSTFYSIDKQMSLKFTLVYTATIILFILISISSDKVKLGALKVHYSFSVSIMILTLISWLIPPLFTILFYPLLSEKAQSAYVYFLNLNELSGISGQTGTNAFLLSVGLAFVIFKKKNLFNIFLIILFSLLIIMSAKRGIILANILAYLSVVLLFVRLTSKKVLISIMLFVLFTILGIFIFTRIGLININTFSSNRIQLYEIAIEIFSANFIFGTGINTFSNYLPNFNNNLGESLNAHNIYFQLLAETGLFGLITFLSVQILTFIYTVRIKKAISNQMEYKKVNYVLSVIYFQIFFFIYSLMGNTLYDYNFFMIYLLLIGSIINIKKTEMN